MVKEKLLKNKIYKVYAIKGNIKQRIVLQKMIDNIEEYARKYNLTLKIEWED